jgi:hypothetical protein
LIDEDSSNDIPSIVVTFPDGHADRLMLRKHYFNEEDRMASKDECHYTGFLAHEKDACVSMTGCIGSEDILFTIISKHAKDSPYFLWTKEGEVNVIERGSIVSISTDTCFVLSPHQCGSKKLSVEFITVTRVYKVQSAKLA